MDIGTAKPKLADRGKRIADRGIRFHLINIINPDVLYSAADFARDAQKVIELLTLQKRPFILVGGSGLYLKALFEPFFSAPPRDLSIRHNLEKESSEKFFYKVQGKFDLLMIYYISFPIHSFSGTNRGDL
jgi:tRNA dimethylallyltransferase